MSVPEYDLRPLSDIFSMCKVTRKEVECSGRITGFRWLEVFKMIPDSRFDVQKKLRDIYAEVGLKVQAPLFWLFVPQLISESRRRLLRWVYREDIPAGRDELSISWLNEAFLDRMPCKPQIELNDLWGQLLWTGQVDLLVKFLDHIDSLYLCKQYSTRCEYAQHYSNHWKRPDQNFRHIAYPIPPPDPNSSNLPEFGVIPVPLAQQAPVVPASVGSRDGPKNGEEVDQEESTDLEDFSATVQTESSPTCGKPNLDLKQDSVHLGEEDDDDEFITEAEDLDSSEPQKSQSKQMKAKKKSQSSNRQVESSTESVQINIGRAYEQTQRFEELTQVPVAKSDEQAEKEDVDIKKKKKTKK